MSPDLGLDNGMCHIGVDHTSNNEKENNDFKRYREVIGRFDALFMKNWYIVNLTKEYRAIDKVRYSVKEIDKDYGFNTIVGILDYHEHDEQKNLNAIN